MRLVLLDYGESPGSIPKHRLSVVPNLGCLIKSLGTFKFSKPASHLEVQTKLVWEWLASEVWTL